MDFYKGLPILYFESQAAWEAWLEEHQAVSQGLWLKTAKKPETRLRRMQKFIAMLNEHKTIH